MRPAATRESAPPRSDIPFDASVVRAAKAGAAPATAGRGFGKWFRNWLKSAAVTLAAMYVVSWCVLTFGVAYLNSLEFVTPKFSNTARRMVVADAAAPFGLPADLSITPQQAGRAYFAISTPSRTPSPRFPQVAIADRPMAPWRAWTRPYVPAFQQMLDPSYNGPDHKKILAAVKRGFTPAEKELLRSYATAPIWRDFDRFARAPAADMIGARFVVPFRADAVVYEMPILKFAETKEMAYVSVARAAWHLSEGRPDSAALALRSAISFGQAITNNASSVIEQLIGAVVTGIGREALVELYAMTGDPRGAAMVAAARRAEHLPFAEPAIEWLAAGDARDKRAALLQVATSSKTPRGLRFEALNALVFSSCANPRALVTGPDASVRAAFDQARRDLARYPSELALIDLMAGTLERIGRRADPGDEELTPAGILAFAGRIYFNPRLVACAMATPVGSAWNVLR